MQAGAGSSCRAEVVSSHHLLLLRFVIASSQELVFAAVRVVVSLVVASVKMIEAMSHADKVM